MLSEMNNTAVSRNSGGAKPNIYPPVIIPIADGIARFSCRIQIIKKKALKNTMKNKLPTMFVYGVVMLSVNFRKSGTVLSFIGSPSTCPLIASSRA